MTFPLHIIVQATAEASRLSPSELTGPSRRRELAWARQIGMVIAKQYTSRTWREIATAFGREDHATASHGVRSMQDRLEAHDDLALQRLAIIDRAHALTEKAIA